MDFAEVGPLLKSLREQMAAKAARLAEVQKELLQLNAEHSKLSVAVQALERLQLPVTDPETEGLALTDVILNAVRANPSHNRNTLVAVVVRQAQSKSADPRRVATVRIAQLLKEGKLLEVGGRLRIGPNADPNLPTNAS
jgi:hypothetical protein